MSSFAQGFGMGTQMWNQAVQNNRLDAEAERQAKLDAMRTEEHGKRMTMLDGQIGDAQRVRDQEAERAQAGQDVVANESATVVGPDGSASMWPDAAAANAAIEGMRADGDETPYTVGKAGTVNAGKSGWKTFLEPDGGIEAANKYAGASNTFDAKAARVAAIMEKQNFSSAMDFRTKTDAYKVATYDASLKALTRHAAEAAYKGDLDGLVNLAKPFLGGSTAQHETNADGSGSIFTLDKDGNKVGALNFKNKDDLALQITRQINPEQAVASYAAQLADAAKEGRKIHVLAPGATAMDGTGKVIRQGDALKPGYEWVMNPITGEPTHAQRPMATGNALLRADGRTGKQKLGQVSETLKATYGQNPTMLAQAMGHRDALYENNPDMSEAQADALADKIVSGNGEGVVRELNLSTGLIDQKFQDNQKKDASGKPIGTASNRSYLLGSTEFNPASMPKEEGVKAAEIIAKTANPQQLELYKSSVTEQGLQEFNEALATRAKSLTDKYLVMLNEAKASGDSKAAADIQAEYLKEEQKDNQAIQAEARKAAIFRQFYVEKKEPPKSAYVPSKAAQYMADYYSNNGGM
jgi:hypothetical protein